LRKPLRKIACLQGVVGYQKIDNLCFGNKKLKQKKIKRANWIFQFEEIIFKRARLPARKNLFWRE